MKTRTDLVQVLLPAVATALLMSACSGAQQVHAVAPGAASLQGQETRLATASVPNTPTASNIHISEEILRACNIPDTDAYFAFDSAHLTSFDGAPLDALASCFSHGPMAGRRMRLVGHADPRGGSEYNMTLGQSRADAVESYLADRALSPTVMTASSRGAMDATGRDETGWAHDRRVDVLLAD